MSSLYCVHQVKERPDVGVYVKDLSAFVVNNADDMDRIMTLGNKNSEHPNSSFSFLFPISRIVSALAGHYHHVGALLRNLLFVLR